MASRSKKENFQNQQPIETLKGHSAGEPQSVVMRPMADVGFWKERRDDFSSGDIEKEHGSLCADWDSITETWGFRGGSGGQSVRAFKRRAQIAAKGLKGPRTSPPWKVWLDFMQHEKWDFRVTGIKEISLSTPGQEYFIRMGIPTSVVGTAKTIFVNKALAAKLKAAQGITIKTGETIKQGNFRGIVGTIERLFKTSAEFCLELKARAWELPSKRVRKEESTQPS